MIFHDKLVSNYYVLIIWIYFGIVQILVGLVSSFRYDKEVVDMDVAKLEADRLHEAIKTKQLDDDDVVYILGTRNVYQLRTTFECYKQKYGNPIDQVQFPPYQRDVGKFHFSLCFTFSVVPFFFFGPASVSTVEQFIWTFSVGRTSRTVGRVIWNLYWR